MKSTSGAHFIALDHIRAVAALLVFVWHFIHGAKGYPVPFDGSPFWGPLVLLDEGHVGVALFMTLSGYLFAKLLDGKQVKYHLFLWNRCLRLFPLLLLVFFFEPLIQAVEAKDIRVIYWAALGLMKGFILPTWPHGGWSIATELHFYLILPILLIAQKKGSLLLLLFIALALAFRIFFYANHGEVQSIAYWTIFGRIDQFVFGILGFYFSGLFTKRHWQVALILVAFISVYYWFDVNGGFYLTDGYPSRSAIWIWLPTVEGAAFAVFIAWYETSFNHRTGHLSSAVSRVGEYSYSIYLLHGFFVFSGAVWIHENLMDISNFYVALPVSVAAFCFMIPVGFVSMKLVEAPFLRLRKPYYVKNIAYVNEVPVGSVSVNTR